MIIRTVGARAGKAAKAPKGRASRAGSSSSSSSSGGAAGGGLALTVSAEPVSALAGVQVGMVHIRRTRDTG